MSRSERFGDDIEQILIVRIAFQINIFELRKLRNFLVDPMQIAGRAIDNIYKTPTFYLLAGNKGNLSSAFLTDGIAFCFDRRMRMRTRRKRSAARYGFKIIFFKPADLIKFYFAVFYNSFLSIMFLVIDKIDHQTAGRNHHG